MRQALVGKIGSWNGFIYRLMGRHHDEKIQEILTETKTVVQGYLHGLLAEFGIIAILNSAGLLILGLDYAILLGVGGALLNVIPIPLIAIIKLVLDRIPELSPWGFLLGDTQIGLLTGIRKKSRAKSAGLVELRV